MTTTRARGRRSSLETRSIIGTGGAGGTSGGAIGMPPLAEGGGTGSVVGDATGAAAALARGNDSLAGRGAPQKRQNCAFASQAPRHREQTRTSAAGVAVSGVTGTTRAGAIAPRATGWGAGIGTVIGPRPLPHDTQNRTLGSFHAAQRGHAVRTGPGTCEGVG
jgi:hypothetical protein